MPSADRSTKKAGSARALRTVALLAVTAATFLAVAALVRRAVPWPEERGLRAKYEYFAAHKDEFDTVYIGSSRVIRAIDPRVVDAELAARGIEQRSFNFGADGMMSFESDFVLRELLALEPRRLDTIVFEGGTWYPGFDEPGSTSPDSWRCAFWHTPGATWQALRSVMLLDRPLVERADLARIHAVCMARKVANYSQGARILARALGTDAAAIDADISASTVAEALGYQPLEVLTGKVHTQGREVFLGAIDRYRELIAKIPADNARPVALDSYNFAALEDQLDVVARRRAELVYVVLPNRIATPHVPAVHALGRIPHLFHFNRPDVYPELYELENHYDAGHLSQQGAQVFSRLLARALAERVRPEGSD